MGGVGLRMPSLLANFDFSLCDELLNVSRVLAVNGAADGHAGSEDFFDSTGKVAGHGARTEFLGNRNNLVHVEFAVVDNVLGLLPVTRRFLQGFDDGGCCSRDDGDGGLSVLNHDLDVDFDALPVFSGLLDVFSYLLGG